MARTETVRAGETLDDFLKRMGITEEEFWGLNPDMRVGGWMEGASIMLPEVAPAAPAGEAPEAMLPTNAQGLFEEMLKDFRKAFQTYLSAPGFIRNMETAVAGREAGKGAGPGWSRQEAEFMRQNEQTYASQYEEQVQRQFAETGKLPTLSPEEFLRTIKPRTEMEMRSSESPGGRPRVPSVGVRRLRF